MAAEGDSKELMAHEKSYVRFLSMMKWGTAVSLLTGALVILIIYN